MTPREIRFKKGLTQWDLCIKTGIPQSKLSLAERGYISFSEKEKALIAEAFGLSVAEVDWSEVTILHHQSDCS